MRPNMVAASWPFKCSKVWSRASRAAATCAGGDWHGISALLWCSHQSWRFFLARATGNLSLIVIGNHGNPQGLTSSEPIGQSTPPSVLVPKPLAPSPYPSLTHDPLEPSTRFNRRPIHWAGHLFLIITHRGQLEVTGASDSALLCVRLMFFQLPVDFSSLMHPEGDLLV